MLVQHLSVMSSKYFFTDAAQDVHCVWAGLSQTDADRYGLKPLTIIGLSVEGTRPKYLQLFDDRDGVELHRFLMEAWTDLEVLAGVPDQLLVDPELLAEFDVVECVHSLAPGVEVAGVMTKRTAASKRDLQQQSLEMIHWKTSINSRPCDRFNSDSPALGQINQALKGAAITLARYEASSHDRKRRDAFCALLARPKRYPQQRSEGTAVHQARLKPSAWMTKGLKNLPEMVPGQELSVKYVGNVRLIYLTAPEGDLEYVSDDPWLKNTLKALSFSAEGIATLIGVSPEMVRLFASGKSPLKVHSIQSLLDELKECSVICPESALHADHAYNLITDGLDVSFSTELVPTNPLQKCQRYRYMFVECHSGGRHLMLFEVGSAVDSDKLVQELGNVEPEPFRLGPTAYDLLCSLTGATDLSDIKAARNLVAAVGDMVDLERHYQTEFY